MLTKAFFCLKNAHTCTDLSDQILKK